MQLIDSGGRNGRMRIRVGAFRFGNLPGSKLLANRAAHRVGKFERHTALLSGAGVVAYACTIRRRKRFCCRRISFAVLSYVLTSLRPSGEQFPDHWPSHRVGRNHAFAVDAPVKWPRRDVAGYGVHQGHARQKEMAARSALHKN